MDIHYIFEADITGDVEALRTVVDELISATQQEPGTVQYQWYLDEERSKLFVHEGFDSSASLVTHLQNAQALLPKLFEHAKPAGLQVFGDPDESAAAAIGQMRGRVAGRLAGFTR